jgi:hypothetical protein
MWMRSLPAAVLVSSDSCRDLNCTPRSPQRGDDLDQVAQVAPERVQAPHHEGVAFVEALEQPVEFGAAVQRAGDPVGVDASAAGFL